MAFIFGWLLGILSAILSTLGIDLIKKYIQKKEFKKGILTELKEVRSLLASTIYLNSPRFGAFNRELIRWVHDIYREDAGLTVSSQTINDLNQKLQLNDQEIHVLGQGRAAGAELRGISHKKYLLPFLDTNIIHLGLFDTEFQRRIIGIRERLRRLNEEIDLSRWFYQKTFDTSLDDGNRTTINRNLDECYEHIFEISREIANKITEAIQDS